MLHYHAKQVFFIHNLFARMHVKAYFCSYEQKNQTEMTKYLYTFLALTVLMLAGCNKAKEEPQKEVYHNVRTIPTEIVDKGNQAVQKCQQKGCRLH